MVRNTLKILQRVLQDFLSVSDHFTVLPSKKLICFWQRSILKYLKNIYVFSVFLNLCLTNTFQTFGFLVFSGGIKWEHWPEMV